MRFVEPIRIHLRPSQGSSTSQRYQYNATTCYVGKQLTWRARGRPAVSVVLLCSLGEQGYFIGIFTDFEIRKTYSTANQAMSCSSMILDVRRRCCTHASCSSSPDAVDLRFSRQYPCRQARAEKSACCATSPGKACVHLTLPLDFSRHFACAQQLPCVVRMLRHTVGWRACWHRCRRSTSSRID